MPDPKTMPACPLPVADVAPGTVVVRVIRGTLANNIPDQPVELTGAGAPRTVKTDAAAGPSSPGWRPGRASPRPRRCRVSGCESQEFPVPASGGTRLLLVATDPDVEKRAAEDRSLASAPAQAGLVVIGEESRFVFELGDGSLSVFNLLQFVNTARTPVNPPQPIVFELAAEATGVSILKDSSPQATAADGKVTVVGPFAPGITQRAVRLLGAVGTTGNLTIEQTLPIPLGRVIVLAQKSGGHAGHLGADERTARDAGRRTDLRGRPGARRFGPASGYADRFSDLPHEALWPRYTAVGLAVAILAVGWWAVRARRAGRAPDRADRIGWRNAGATTLRRAHDARGATPGRPRRPAALRRPPGRAGSGARARVRGDRSVGGVTDGSRLWALGFTDLAEPCDAVARRSGSSLKRRSLEPPLPWISPPSFCPTSRAATGGAGRSTASRCAARPARSSGSLVPTAPASRRCCRWPRRFSRRRLAPSSYGDARRSRDAGAARSASASLGHDLYLYPELTAAENLVFYGRLLPRSRRGAARRRGARARAT